MKKRTILIEIDKILVTWDQFVLSIPIPIMLKILSRPLNQCNFRLNFRYWYGLLVHFPRHPGYFRTRNGGRNHSLSSIFRNDVVCLGSGWSCNSAREQYGKAEILFKRTELGNDNHCYFVRWNGIPRILEIRCWQQGVNYTQSSARRLVSSKIWLNFSKFT